MILKRLLVTTSIKETCIDSEPILFLGKWCVDTDDDISSDYIVCKPFGIKPKIKKNNFEFIIDVEKKLLPQLINKLNIIHKISYSNRQWNLLLGQWLRRFISVSFNKYFNIAETLNSYDIKTTKKINISRYDHSTKDSLDFVLACDDELWNHFFYLKVLDFLGFKNIENVDINESLKRNTFLSNSQQSRLKNIKKFLFAKLSSVLTKDEDAFLIGTYLPRRIEFFLHLALGQAPQRWSHVDMPDIQTNFKLREKFLNDTGYEGFEKFLRKIIGDFFPRAFLENFNNYHKKAINLPWPKNPKFIYTANNYDFDEAFKFWVADKIKLNVPYYVGQHGSGYSTHNYFQTLHSPEILCSDRFITWGWTDNSKNIKSGFVFTTTDYLYKLNKKGGLVLILACPLHRFCHWDVYSEYIIYRNKQFEFLESLIPRIFNETTLRLHPNHKNYFPYEIDYLKLKFPSLIIEPGDIEIKKLISKNRLVVHAYDSTGLLETLSLNIPTLAFFPDGYSHLLPNAIRNYRILEEAGILYRSPQLLAQKIEKIWSQIDLWWQSKKVQGARAKFCNIYAHVSSDPVNEIKEILLSPE